MWLLLDIVIDMDASLNKRISTLLLDISQCLRPMPGSIDAR